MTSTLTPCPAALELGFVFLEDPSAPCPPKACVPPLKTRVENPWSLQRVGIDISLPTWPLASDLCEWLGACPCLLIIKILRAVGPASAWYLLVCLVHPLFLRKLSEGADPPHGSSGLPYPGPPFLLSLSLALLTVPPTAPPSLLQPPAVLMRAQPPVLHSSVAAHLINNPSPQLLSGNAAIFPH